MRSPNRCWAWWALLLCGSSCGGSGAVGDEPRAGGHGDAGGVSSGAAGGPSGGTGTSGAAGGGATAGGAAAGVLAGGASNAEAGGGGASSGAGQSGAGAGQSGAGAGQSGAGARARCEMIEAEYAAELGQQLGCNPNAAQQCTDRAAAAPGCSCRVFIQPSDPFAIEHLSDVASGWFDADCSLPSCPPTCTTAAVGTCQVDANEPSGGRCVTP